MATKPHKRKLEPGFSKDGKSVDMAEYTKSYVEDGVAEMSLWISKLIGGDLSDQVDPFFESIQSGVLLAKLIKAVSPEHAFKFKDNAKRDSFFARQNVEDFCTACKNLGVPEVSTFSSNDLIERQSDVRVLVCLRYLRDKFGTSESTEDAKMEDVNTEKTVKPEKHEAPIDQSSASEGPQRKQQKTSEASDEKVYNFTITKRKIRLSDDDVKLSLPIEILKKPEERKHAHAEDESVKEALEQDNNPFVKFMRKKSFISNVVLEEFENYIKTRTEREKIKSDDVCISLCKTKTGYILFFKPQPDWFFYYPVATTSFQGKQEEKSSDEYRVVAVEAI